MSHLVLLSGWGVDARIWQALDGHWPDDVTTSAPEWPGYGRRDPLTHPDDLTELARTMRADLPAEAIWVGWSLGGLLAAALLEHLPAPRALVMLGMAPRFVSEDGKGGVTSSQLAVFRESFARAPRRTWVHFLRWQLSGEPSPRSALQRLNDLLGDYPPADIPTLESGLEQLAQLDLHTTLAQAECPVVHVHGESDSLLPAMDSYLPSIALAECGHCPQLSNPGLLVHKLTLIAETLNNSQPLAEIADAC